MSKEAEEYLKENTQSVFNGNMPTGRYYITPEQLTDFHKSQLEKITEEDIKVIAENTGEHPYLVEKIIDELEELNKLRQ